ncbi:hypothetical protein SAMN05878071_3427 [Pseudoalteromonas marina]|nr:hypothetical protein SAMN05878071_3427 [Pseudoalteromonas marina]
MRRAELLDHFSKSVASLTLFVNNGVFGLLGEVHVTQLLNEAIKWLFDSLIEANRCV